MAGTQVVRYMIVSTAERDSADAPPASESGGAGTLVLVALGSITAGVFVRREDERRRREDQKRQNARARDRLFGPPPDDEENDLPWDEDDDPWTEPVDAPWAGPADDASGDAAHRARIDRLCDALFHGDEDFDPLSDDSLAGDWVARPEARRAWLNCEPSLPSSTALAPPRRVKKRRTSQRPEQPAVRTVPSEPRKSLRLRWPMLAASLLALLLFAPGILSSWRSPPPIAASTPASKYVTTSIEQLRVGDWVLARNPEVSEEEREEAGAIVPEQWRRIALRMEKPDGTGLEIELLRPADWLEGGEARPGDWVWLDLAELGAEGEAEILAVGPCPAAQHLRSHLERERRLKGMSVA